ncbi:hypothetical protein [Persephonella sp.]
MKCPRCKSENTGRWASRNYCRDCNYTWTKGKRNRLRGFIECIDCGSKNTKIKDTKIIDKGLRSARRRRFICKDCGATWWENANHIKVRNAERRHWIKWIKEEVEKGTDIEYIKQYISDTTGLKNRSVCYLIQQAVGSRRKVIPEDAIKKAIYWREQGLKWKDIARIVGYSRSALINRVRKMQEGA